MSRASRAPVTDAIGFAERVVALLDEGAFTATYKYAVLLGLLDVVLERTGRAGEPPDVVTTRQLAEKVVELYRPHRGGGCSEGTRRPPSHPLADSMGVGHGAAAGAR